ncbi:MAG: hypothetical protein KME30_28760 [Iphinoe sp. HA4291-MV1]|jgi:hypothetical protein|nr:hypothetical protein [Iphinoe sp. HA4291-MV1]
MTISNDLLSVLRALPRADKLRLMQFLVSELAQEEGVTSLVEGGTYRVLSPYNSHEAAHKLEELLQEHQQKKES